MLFLINFGYILRCGYIDGKKNWILVGMNALLNGGKWSLLTWLIFRKKNHLDSFSLDVGAGSKITLSLLQDPFLRVL